MEDKKVLEETTLESNKDYNGFGGVPQKSTLGGLTLIAQQLMTIWSDVGWGDFATHFSSMTVGVTLQTYWPILVALFLIFINEKKVLGREL